ncbi:hypothetical protein ACHAWF_016372, partial [Thalassiosira exigua]
MAATATMIVATEGTEPTAPPRRRRPPSPPPAASSEAPLRRRPDDGVIPGRRYESKLLAVLPTDRPPRGRNAKRETRATRRRRRRGDDDRHRSEAAARAKDADAQFDARRKGRRSAKPLFPRPRRDRARNRPKEKVLRFRSESAGSISVVWGARPSNRNGRRRGGSGARVLRVGLPGRSYFRLRVGSLPSEWPWSSPLPTARRRTDGGTIGWAW